MVVLMATSLSSQVPYFSQDGDSKRRTSSVSHDSPTSSKPSRRRSLSLRSTINSRSLSLLSIKSALAEAHRQAPKANRNKMSSHPSSRDSPKLAPPAARPGASRSTSESSVKSAVGRFQETLRPSVSTRDSQAELPVPTPSHHLDVPAHPPNTPRRPSGENLRSDVSGPVTDHIQTDTLIPGTAVTELLAGQTGKAFKVHTDLLKTRSPYFSALFSSPSPPTAPTLAFPDLDEFAFALFVRWLYGAELRGPADFHSMQHYLALYVLARRFRVERLQNEALDAVRAYYRANNMTAPAYRLEYVYRSTAAPNALRRFLVATAAYRYLCEREPRLSDSMKGVVAKGGDLAVDFAEQLAGLHQSELQDARKGPDCAWHVHEETPVCKAKIAEAYE